MYIQFFFDFVRGKARARTGGGHQYTPAQTRSDMQAIAAAYREACDRWLPQGAPIKAPKGVPVTLRIMCQRELPRSRPKKVEWEFDTTKPDVDNISKLVMDALNGVAWHDDAQVTKLSCWKCLRERDRGNWSHITISWEDEDEWLDVGGSGEGHSEDAQS